VLLFSLYCESDVFVGVCVTTGSNIDVVAIHVDLYRLRRYIEHCERCVSAFLRGFAYSEGNVDKSGYIYIYNTVLRLLTYIHGSS
jgi:hypothetical protein